MWYFMLSSGIHATLTGVLLAFAIPFGSGREESPSYILQSILHAPVAYFILPVFALANTCILVDAAALSTLDSDISLGIMLGLFAGKPLGVLLFAYIATVIGVSALPVDLRWGNIIGAGLLAGIGFTMSIFITLLAFEQQVIIDASKLSVMVASLAAGIVGFFWLKKSLPDGPVVTGEV